MMPSNMSVMMPRGLFSGRHGNNGYSCIIGKNEV